MRTAAAMTIRCRADLNLSRFQIKTKQFSKWYSQQMIGLSHSNAIENVDFSRTSQLETTGLVRSISRWWFMESQKCLYRENCIIFEKKIVGFLNSNLDRINETFCTFIDFYFFLIFKWFCWFKKKVCMTEIWINLRRRRRIL